MSESGVLNCNSELHSYWLENEHPVRCDANGATESETQVRSASIGGRGMSFSDAPRSSGHAPAHGLVVDGHLGVIGDAAPCSDRRFSSNRSLRYRDVSGGLGKLAFVSCGGIRAELDQTRLIDPPSTVTVGNESIGYCRASVSSPRSGRYWSV